MSTNATKRMISVYKQRARTPLMFMSGFFRSPAENFFSGQSVEMDVVRGTENVAVAVTDMSTGYRMNAQDLYTNKEFIPPVYMEGFGVHSKDLMLRQAGMNPFENPNYRAALIDKIMDGMVLVEGKIRRAIEFQAASVLQTAKAVLKDLAGATIYSIDYQPKATHFPTAGVSWATATGKQMMDNIAALGVVIRTDGLADPTDLLFGTDAFEAFIRSSDVQARLDNRNMNLGSIVGAQPRGSGATFQGRIQIGDYVYNIWTYSNRYVEPDTGNSVPYLDPGKVVMLTGDARLDALFGAIPNIGQLLNVTGPQMFPEIPSRISSSEQSIDLFTNVWVTPDGVQLSAGVGCRPLLVPTAIDTFGCLNTQL